MMSYGASWGILAGFCLLSFALATQDSRGASSARQRPFAEYRVNLGARDPFSSGPSGSEAATAPEGTGGGIKAVPGSGNGGGTPGTLAEKVLLQSIAAGPQGPDMAIINGMVVKVGQTFAIDLDGTRVELTLVEVVRNPPQVRLRWGTQEFVKSLKPKGDKVDQ